MSSRNGVKIAAAASLVIFALWLLVSLTAYVFQDSVVKLMGSSVLADETGRIIILPTVAQFTMSIPVAAACYMVINEKDSTLPLVLSAAFSITMPVVTTIANVIQSMFISHLGGTSELVRYSCVTTLNSWISFLLNPACIIAVAAAAVHCYAAKNGHFTKDSYYKEDI